LTRRFSKLPEVVRILGLDPGSRTTGWGLVDRSSGHLAARFGCLHPPRNVPRPRALAVLAEALAELLERETPDVVAIETPFTGRFPRAVIGLAETRGAMLAALGRWGGEVVEYEPARVKSVIVGFGTAEKQQVAFMVCHELSLASPPPPDAADALAVALCHLRLARLDL
jgi:crossover junction endodeoxyribonuclease RuvC